MKIRAVRLRELGCFSDPVALEGLSGGLDVLAGPNELGKSTILRALEALFKVRHTAQSRTIERLRPYTGGAPLIEADFDIGGRTWRLRKQYLSDRQAVLTDLTVNKVVARGDEAHRRTLELIGGGGEHRLGLLWLEQGMSLQPATPKDAEREQLSRVIEREVSAASGGGHDLRVIRAMVVQQRRALVTDHRPPRPTGDYGGAIASRNDAERALEAARSEARAATGRIDRVQLLRARRAELIDPAFAASRRQRIEKLSSDMESATTARQQLKLAEARVQACESSVSEAQQAHDLMAKMLDEVHELEIAASAAATTQSSIAAALEDLATRLKQACGRRDDLRAALETESERLRARQRFDSRREAAARLAEITRRLSEARSATEIAGEIRARLDKECVTETSVHAAAREAASIEALEARIGAQLPKVRIAYLPDGAGKIRVDGNALQEGAILVPSRPMSLEIDGIGTIAIDPNVSDSIEEDQADLEAHRSVLAELLAGMGVADLATARQRLEERQRLERDLAQAEDRIATRAPEGLARLTDEIERLTELSEAGDDDGAELPESPVIETEIERLRGALRESEDAANQLSQEHAKLREDLARCRAESRSREDRLSKLAAQLPPVDERPARLVEHEAKLAAVREAMNEALRERGAWREKAPDDAGLRALEAELAEAKRAEHSAADELTRVDRDLAVLERELERDQQDGIAARVEELEQKVQSFDEQVRHFEREVAALDLLLETLSQVEQQSRELYLSPVLQRLNPYMQLVFPGATVGIGRDLGVEAIARGAAREPLSALSDGTQEQIAVLVRLAFARLLADAGQPTPLILDDALVYSDDDRIESLFDALRQAAGAHQVIIFTCRSRAFEQLGGTGLSLVPWADP